MLWQPIDSLLGGVKTIYYSPSGLLHRLNLSAISTPKPPLRLADQYQLVLLRSTRELALSPEKQPYANTALLMGDIEYNLDTLAYQRANVSFRQATKHQIELDRGAGQGSSYPRLDYAGEEMDSVTTVLKATGIRTDTLRGLRASEEAFYFYTQTSSPRIIHLATHGFFLEDTLTRKKRDKDLRFDQEPVFITSGNPMIRSGLVLAGGNQAWSGNSKPQLQSDGNLTAAEVSALNLRQTELVVLSACETGLGDIKGTEGVFGLQRAFKMAGAKYLLMSLWRVQDDVASLFMSDFYRQWLQEKKSIRAAYERAIANLRRTHRNPYAWAAFVLIE